MIAVVDRVGLTRFAKSLAAIDVDFGKPSFEWSMESITSVKQVEPSGRIPSCDSDLKVQ